MAELVDQLFRVDHVSTDRQIRPDSEVGDTHVQQRKVVGCHKERDALLLRVMQNLHRVRIERMAQHFVEHVRRANGEPEMEARVTPPLASLQSFLFLGHVSVELKA